MKKPSEHVYSAISVPTRTAGIYTITRHCLGLLGLSQEFAPGCRFGATPVDPVQEPLKLEVWLQFVKNDAVLLQQILHGSTFAFQSSLTVALIHLHIRSI